MKKGVVFLLLLAVVLGCQKAPGPGGTSSIKGKVIIRKFDPNFHFLASYPDVQDNVYINYGSQPGVGNSVKTDYNGEYYFPYLYSGAYTIYVYSLDTTQNNPSGQLVAKQVVNLGNGKDITLPDITIAK